MKTDNSTATGFIYDNIHQRRSKAWDMNLYWLRDRMTQEQFKFYWDRGVNNDADYFTKHHATVDHRAKRTRYVKDKLSFLRSAQPGAREGVLIPPVRTEVQTPVWPALPKPGWLRSYLDTRLAHTSTHQTRSHKLGQIL